MFFVFVYTAFGQFVLGLFCYQDPNCIKLFETEVRSSPSEVILGKGVLKICSKFTGEHPCRIAISIKLQSNFFEIALRHGCSPVNLLHIFRTLFPKNTSERLLLYIFLCKNNLFVNIIFPMIIHSLFVITT